MKLLKVSVLFVLFLMAAACSQEEDLILGKEATRVNDLVKVKLVDPSSGTKKEVTTEYLKEKWEKEALEDGYDVVFSTFELVETGEKSAGKALYFLKAVSADRTVETGAFFMMGADGEYELGKKKCSCAGCRLGCRLSTSGGKCNCSSCPGDYKVCTKTEEAVIEDKD